MSISLGFAQADLLRQDISMSETYDVVIIGGGPSGSTVGSLLKKHAPNLKVGIFEREIFPREHVGESLLPSIGRILDEIGVWDAVEAAGFPIKIGATYKWGTTDELWDFNLLDTREVEPNAPRPGKYEGWRMRSAFQVERSRFDTILLDRSAELGCDVHQGVGVSKVVCSDDEITHVELSNGEVVTGRYYIDASGNAAVLRKGVGVQVVEPPSLQNVAFYDYWEDAEWAVSIGTGATRVQVTSLGYGWIWVIPISATRTSIGLVCPKDYYKKSGKRPEEIYAQAVRTDPRIAALISNAKQTGPVQGTKDWSFLATRMTGKNWFLVGECAGFADPILAAGMTMSMVGALECAYTIIESDRGEQDVQWLKDQFAQRQELRISQHIQFANFWYSANAHFTDLMEYTSEIARQAGHEMDAKSAWQWLGTGGFVSLETAGAGLAGHSLEQIKALQMMMFDEESEWLITKSNVFDLDIEGAETATVPVYFDGRIRKGNVLKRAGKELPIKGGFRIAIEALQKSNKLSGVIAHLRLVSAKMGPVVALSGLEALETMVREGWVKGSIEKGQPLLRPQDIPRTSNIDWNHDKSDPKVRVASATVS